MRNNKQFDLSAFMNLMKNADNTEKKQTADKIISGLNNNEQAELDKILADRSKIDAILNSSAARQIIEKINGKNDGKLK
ncbi:MAG: hypothetical protein U0K91_09735 [Acutalibacteraceae bacterium]|nr:hypothetical protein [Acutalibacteraceae bacterium]